MTPEARARTAGRYLLGHDDELRPCGSLGLTPPRLGHRVQSDSLDIEAHVSGNSMGNETGVVLREDSRQNGVDGEPDKGQALEPDRLGREGGCRTRRLAEVDDGRARYGSA